MYFWKTNMLADDLKNGETKQSDFKNYLIFEAGITMVAINLHMVESYVNVYLTIVEKVLTIIITVIGIIVTYKTNGGDEGVEYLNRYISLSLPLSLKFLLTGFLIAFILGTMHEFSAYNLQLERLISASLLLVYCVYYWRMNVHIRYINA